MGIEVEIVAEAGKVNELVSEYQSRPDFGCSKL